METDISENFQLWSYKLWSIPSKLLASRELVKQLWSSLTAGLILLQNHSIRQLVDQFER